MTAKPGDALHCRGCYPQPEFGITCDGLPPDDSVYFPEAYMKAETERARAIVTASKWRRVAEGLAKYGRAALESLPPDDEYLHPCHGYLPCPLCALSTALAAYDAAVKEES